MNFCYLADNRGTNTKAGAMQPTYMMLQMIGGTTMDDLDTFLKTPLCLKII